MARALAFAGAGCLLVSVLTHVAEQWDILPGMGWGQPDSPGHYLDLFSVTTGVALLVAAFVTWRGGRNRIRHLAKGSAPREPK